MAMAYGTVIFPLLAAMSAAGAGFCCWDAYRVAMRRLRHRSSVRAMQSTWLVPLSGILSKKTEKSGNALHDLVIESMIMTTRRIFLGLESKHVPVKAKGISDLEASLKPAGLEGIVSPEGVWQTRVHLAFLGGVIGVIGGLLFSVELGLLLSVLGAILGFRAPDQAIKYRIRQRAEEMERHLSEMLDVVSLGLRSGLSFDRSLQLYTSHFQTLLASSLDLAQRQWVHGLRTREQALRGVAESYSSTLYSRVTENIIRSLRFGVSMAESLEDAASESRSQYKSRKQEEVAKAPVKIMLPTGVLILPAMLILVLGPVLLELMEGF